MKIRRAPWCLLLAAFIAGCGGSGADAEATSETTAAAESSDTGDSDFAPLIDHLAWNELDAASDPLADHRPDPVTCTIAGWLVEDNHLEINTNECNYAGLHQPSLVDLVEGHDVQLILYHFDLVAPEPATAHLAILVAGELLWEQNIEIPSMANVYDLVFPSPITAPAGSDVVFHLHNHGQNTWTLQDLGTRN